MITAITAAPKAIPATASGARVEDEHEEEAGLYVGVGTGITAVDEVIWVASKEATKKDWLLLLVKAEAVPDVAEALDATVGVAVALEGAEIVVNAENAPKFICGVVSQSQL
jgi:hypothetical protein